MRIEILTIGDELLLGFTIDTNAAHLARELAAVGIEIVRRGTVGDAARDIAAGVREAMERTGAVITTGGLGPTADDLTKPAIAELFGREMVLDPAVLERLRAMWKSRGWPGEMPASNRQQAMIPSGARILTNRHGSAPGIWLEDERGRWVAMLPGVPREMRGMLADELLPVLRPRASLGAAVVRSRTLRTTGIGESALADRLGELAKGFGDMPLASLPSADGTDLRLTSRGLDQAAAERALDDAFGKLRERAGSYVYGEGSDDLAAVVLELCRSHGLRVAVAESCTGGLLGARLTAIPGASDVMLGGVIAYDNMVKQRLLGVSEDDLREHGAVSEVVVRRMATGVRELVGADVGIGITGIAGPGGGSDDKPVGTVWLSVDVGGSVTARRTVMVGDREEVRRRAAQSALDMLRRAILADPI
jgi:nicotinamide-nucleotide amidase